MDENYIRVVLRGEHRGSVDVQVVENYVPNQLAGRVVTENGDVVMASFVISLDDVLTVQKLAMFQGRLIVVGDPHVPQRLPRSLQPQGSLLEALAEVEQVC